MRAVTDHESSRYSLRCRAGDSHEFSRRKRECLRIDRMIKSLSKLEDKGMESEKTKKITN